MKSLDGQPSTECGLLAILYGLRVVVFESCAVDDRASRRWCQTLYHLNDVSHLSLVGVFCSWGTVDVTRHILKPDLSERGER